MKKFALVGAAGYIAPRHIQAIYDTGNELIAAIDPHDSVGVLDRYFPSCEFFTEIERFDRHLEKLKRSGNKIDYLSVCSPNYLHDAHCRLGMRVGADIICEKPLVLNPWNLDQLLEIENETNKKIYVVLQLRLHPEVIKLKKQEQCDSVVQIKYITPRGNWYHRSWKGDVGKSGGLVTNIGIHLFDMVMWLFGKPKKSDIVINEVNKVKGRLVLENADVSWFLSIDRKDLPKGSENVHREITINNIPVRFDNVFTELHTEVYRDILSGAGFGIEDARPSIELVYNMRNQ